MNPLLIAEITAHCFDSLARCFKQGNDARAVGIMKQEIREHARNVAQWRLSGEVKARLFLRPMETALVKHYGAHMGRRLYWDYLDAFWLQSWSVTPLPQIEAEAVESPILEMESDDPEDGRNGIPRRTRLPLSSEEDDPPQGLNLFSARCG